MFWKIFQNLYFLEFFLAEVEGRNLKSRLGHQQSLVMPILDPLPNDYPSHWNRYLIA